MHMGPSQPEERGVKFWMNMQRKYDDIIKWCGPKNKSWNDMWQLTRVDQMHQMVRHGGSNDVTMLLKERCSNINYVT